MKTHPNFKSIYKIIKNIDEVKALVGFAIDNQNHLSKTTIRWENKNYWGKYQNIKLKDFEINFEKIDRLYHVEAYNQKNFKLLARMEGGFYFEMSAKCVDDNRSVDGNIFVSRLPNLFLKHVLPFNLNYNEHFISESLKEDGIYIEKMTKNYVFNREEKQVEEKEEEEEEEKEKFVYNLLKRYNIQFDEKAFSNIFKKKEKEEEEEEEEEEKTFQSVDETIKNIDTMKNYIGRAIDNQKYLTKTTTQWEYKNYWGKYNNSTLRNFKINLEKIDRLYYIHRNNYNSAYRLVARMQGEFYIEMWVHFIDNDDVFGNIFVCRNANLFMRHISLNESRIYNQKLIYKLLTKDGVYIDKYNYYKKFNEEEEIMKDEEEEEEEEKLTLKRKEEEEEFGLNIQKNFKKEKIFI